MYKITAQLGGTFLSSCFIFETGQWISTKYYCRGSTLKSMELVLFLSISIQYNSNLHEDQTQRTSNFSAMADKKGERKGKVVPVLN
jgi:hypothetical protein